LKAVEAVKQNVKETSVQEVQKRLTDRKPFRLIDVREDREWASGHAQGAEHLGRGVIERDIECAVPEKNTEIVLYCGGGFRSALAADSLQKMGYTNVWSMAGGWSAWEAAKLPVEKP
jgi:rhodanese-related sulfurtransferase